MAGSPCLSADDGSPAPAGMDRTLRPSSCATARLPRACGDGPGTRVYRPTDRPTGSPAPAGMDPPDARSASTGQRLPRACGDGPGTRVYRPTDRPAPPRLRGWTRRTHGQLLLASGSPAPAGMDPGSCLRSTSSGRLPRACGDGPPKPQAHLRRDRPRRVPARLDTHTDHEYRLSQRPEVGKADRCRGVRPSPRSGAGARVRPFGAASWIAANPLHCTRSR